MKNIQLIVSTFFFTVGFVTSTLLPKATAEIPEPECKDGTRESACGYNCILSGDGSVAGCAEWPGGKCSWQLSSVSCGPPAPDNWQDEYESSSDGDRCRDCDCDCDQ